MLVAVFRDVRDLSGLNDLLNVLQSLLVSGGPYHPFPCGATREAQPSPILSPPARLTESPQPPQGVGSTIIPVLQIEKLMHVVK